MAWSHALARVIAVTVLELFLGAAFFSANVAHAGEAKGPRRFMLVKDWECTWSVDMSGRGSMGGTYTMNSSVSAKSKLSLDTREQSNPYHMSWYLPEGQRPTLKAGNYHYRSRS